MNMLFNPLTLSDGIVIKNRFYKASMDEQLAPNGHPDHQLANLYGAWAKGGAGMLVTGHVMIDRRHRAAFDSTVVEDESDFAALTRWAQAGTQNGAKLIMQLNHPGKQIPKNLAKTPVAPSAVAITGDAAAFFNPPRALERDEIADIITRFGNAAAIAEKAGFSGVQIHAAHGYLLSQFLSPHHNRREDEWGGSLQNRMRLLLAVYQEIRRRTAKDFLVGVKLNSADFQKSGFDEDESVAVLKAVADAGADWVEISGGNYEAPVMIDGVKESTKKREAYFLDYAAKAKKASNVPLVITGGFRSAAAMEAALTDGSTDMVGIAKPFALIPDLPDQIARGSVKTVSLKPVKTGVAAIDRKLGSILEMGWYMHQMKHISQGKTVQPDYGAWRLLLNILWQNGRAGLNKERG